MHPVSAPAIACGVVLACGAWSLGFIGAEPREDPLERARALHAAGRSEDAAELLFEAREQARMSGNETRAAELQTAWVAIDPEAGATIAAREAAALALGTIVRLDFQSGWKQTADETLTFLRRIDAGTALRMRTELFGAPSSSEAGRLDLEALFGQRDSEDAKLSHRIENGVLTIGPVTQPCSTVWGERLPAEYELQATIAVSKLPCRIAILCPFRHNWEFQQLFVHFTSESTSLHLESYHGSIERCVKAQPKAFDVRKDPKSAGPREFRITRRGKLLSARFDALELDPIEVETPPYRGRVGIRLRESEGSSVVLQNLSVRDLSQVGLR